ncbi:MAG: hypothetical protein A2654_01545 [Candidatus Nealsonbacteria bacterium RIFCSPHIGHO2_01_FULL_43_31]|uniref:Uncharacterized protein n=2 Tax=Candidatus Nealsoniibacteriota TaxID=1817911 RepID=A0A1G2EAC9_9BACT|nr:MAG: hypothetical protein UV98_C0010G0015 [Parcubacteria group bacterium GW2011_GWB1_43_6]OGZ20491.1 MAG: hypothetical protein A2654_01545 [Candidatus Nealsonbacteria bacterium RIFCSPHIGHO2_01_FULL_43_31]OGZ22108.1 MAG: hypothetical protein A3D46_02060 [Candidatus Nealsonbacteria bacterium RIFCSPHIGHO2_02_FULL_43_13]
MAISKERKAEIAYAVLKREKIRDFQIRGLADANNVKKEIGQLAQETGIPKEELLEFAKEFMAEILRETEEKLQKISFSK